jgi:hypothetical protein
MRIAFLNRKRDYLGGDLIALDATLAALQRAGVDCWDGTEDLKSLGRADLIHVFHCNFLWSRGNFKVATWEEKPYVVTPIFYPDEDCGLKPKEIAAWLQMASVILPFSCTEGEEMRVWLGECIPYTPIPNGTDSIFHAFGEGSDRVGVCSVGARKNDGKRRAAVEEACHVLDIPFDYLQGFPHEAMPEQYKRRKVFVSASHTERMSLVIGEALCSGCRVLATSANRGNEWYPGLVTVDPNGSPEYFKEQIRKAYDMDLWDWRPNEAARRLTWSNVAQKLMKVYQEVLQ